MVFSEFKKSKYINSVFCCLVSFLARILPARVMAQRRFFPLWQARGYHITPVHFYQPIPNTAALSNDIWKQNTEIIGVTMGEESQLKRLQIFSKSYRKEYEAFPREKESDSGFYHNQEAFKSVDAEMLYCMVRHSKPLRIIEVGSGMSTLISLEALRRNEEETGKTSDFVAIEPYPKNFLKEQVGITRFINSPVQEIALSEFEILSENDILFIDSTHVLRIGSDVQFLLLEVIPRLKPGVIIHIHDIFLPQEYPRNWVMEENRFWNEQYLLQAFLAFNNSFHVLWAGNYMYQKYHTEVERAFPACRNEERLPGSFWIQRALT